MKLRDLFRYKKNGRCPRCKILFFPFAFLLSIFSCSKEIPLPDEHEKKPEPETTIEIHLSTSEHEEISRALEGIAEVERSGGYYPGLAFTESGLREKAGDYAGAVIAAYKELSWSYGYGDIGAEGVKEALDRTLALFEEDGGISPKQRYAALAASRGALAFSEGKWKEADSFLRGLLTKNEDPDSFLNWMLMVCGMENQNPGAARATQERAAYGAIRARYSSFPEYWFRGARLYNTESPTSAFSGSGSSPYPAAANISGIYAEQCINLCPAGPFAAKCRGIIARGCGLLEGGETIRSKVEIEETARRSVSMEKPELLKDLFPLIALPDNSYTNYAVEVMKKLVSVPGFKKYFEEEAALAEGRLAERLRYISRG